MKPSRPTIPTPQLREEAVQAAVQAATLAFHRREAARPLAPLEFLRQQSHFLRKRWWALQGGVLLLLWWVLQSAGTTGEAQRAMGEATPLVVEGRDMGTVVFPDARFKFFLDASPEVRALRRLRDLAARGVEADLVTLTEQIRQRDSLDRNRAVAPLRPAADAVIVDTSELDIAGVLGVLVHRISVHEGSVTLLP